MIQIKDKVNKTQLFKELIELGKKRFEFTCEPDEDLKVFLDGAEQLFKLLRLPVVSNSLPTDDYWETRCKLMEQVEENNPCDPDINQEQIDAWSKYHNFIKERGQRQ